MKDIIKLSFRSLALFLVACFATFSCDKNSDRYVSYGFYAEVSSPPSLKTSDTGEIKIVIKSDNYKDGIDHEVIYTDSKKSELITPTGDTIKSGGVFKILDVGSVHKYTFQNAEEGEHNLKFSFKNSKDYSFSLGKLISVEK